MAEGNNPELTLKSLTELLASKTQYKERGKLATISKFYMQYFRNVMERLDVPRDESPELIQNTKGLPSPILSKEKIDTLLTYIYAKSLDYDKTKFPQSWKENAVSSKIIAEVYWEIFQREPSVRE